MAYKLLALDMDGTLLTSQKRISPRTREALRNAAQRGIAATLSTGRGPVELEDYREDFAGVVEYGTLISGGLVYDLAHERAIATTPLDADLVHAIIEQGAREQAMVHILAVHDSVVRPHDLAHLEDFGMGIYRPMYEGHCLVTDDIDGYIDQHAHEVIKVNLYHTSVEARERSLAQLSGLPLQLAIAETTSVESTALGVTKAKGLEALCAHVGCSLDECIAVGDANNDLEVMRAAGLAIAMGNATPDVLAIADAVVASNDADGIVEVVERYLMA